jgi:hypothetical protein
MAREIIIAEQPRNDQKPDAEVIMPEEESSSREQVPTTKLVGWTQDWGVSTKHGGVIAAGGFTLKRRVPPEKTIELIQKYVGEDVDPAGYGGIYREVHVNTFEVGGSIEISGQLNRSHLHLEGNQPLFLPGLVQREEIEEGERQILRTSEHSSVLGGDTFDIIFPLGRTEVTEFSADQLTFSGQLNLGLKGGIATFKERYRYPDGDFTRGPKGGLLLFEGNARAFAGGLRNAVQTTFRSEEEGDVTTMVKSVNQGEPLIVVNYESVPGRLNLMDVEAHDFATGYDVNFSLVSGLWGESPVGEPELNGLLGLMVASSFQLRRKALKFGLETEAPMILNQLIFPGFHISVASEPSRVKEERLRQGPLPQATRLSGFRQRVKETMGVR